MKDSSTRFFFCFFHNVSITRVRFILQVLSRNDNILVKDLNDRKTIIKATIAKCELRVVISLLNSDKRVS